MSQALLMETASILLSLDQANLKNFIGKKGATTVFGGLPQQIIGGFLLVDILASMAE